MMKQSVLHHMDLYTVIILLAFVDDTECNLPRCFMYGGYFVRVR